jgi:glycosyltransferase involved in cell wall biosynthesis
VSLTGSEMVSAVIPTHNRPELVAKAVVSALHQTHPRMEVIVVIDGEDRTTEESLAEIRDIRLRVVPLAVNVGGSEARNIGVRAAAGKWIAFLDDDDEWLPQKIATQLEAARRVACASPVISSRLIVRTPAVDFAAPARLYQAGEPLSDYLFYRRGLADGPYKMQTSTLFVPRDLMLAMSFRSGLRRHQDWDWLLRVSARPGLTFQMVPEPLTILRVEDPRPSVSRSFDWEFSLQWARDMRSRFTPRAWSFFIATECISRAIKSRAGAAIYMRLAWEFIAGGTPTVRSLAWLAAFVCSPQSLRTNLRQFLRRRHPLNRRFPVQAADNPNITI